MLSRSSILPYWKHLRLPFQFALAPLFLWGFFLGEGPLDLRFYLGFISLHFFLYPGITAFNSAYDQDIGPVSGLLEPPKVPRHLLALSVLLQILGGAIASAVGAAFLLIYCAIAALAALYSHPATRLKAKPVGSAAAVAIGQGGLGFAAGWCAAADPQALWSERGTLGAAGAALTTLGMYPVTQVFQVEEDAGRGDRTWAVAFGPARALRLGGLSLIGAGVLTTILVARQFGGTDAILVTLAYGAILLHQDGFAKTIEGNRPLNNLALYRRAMRTYYSGAAAFFVFIMYRVLSG